MKLNKIKVYGKLKQDLGSSYFEAAVNSPLEAFKFLIANFPDLEKYMSNQYYKIKMNGKDLTEDELEMKSDGLIQIIPVATGAFDPISATIGGIGAIIGGSAASTATSGFLSTTIFGVKGLIGKVVGAGLTTVGSKMAVGGVTEIISPHKSMPLNSSSSINRNDGNLKDSNYSFSSIANISRSGVTLNLVYGEMLVGSIVVSNGIDLEQKTNFNPF